MNVVEIVSNKAWGGGERYVLDLCRSLRADGHDVSVYTRPSSAATGVFAGEGLLKGSFAMSGIRGIIAPVRLASELNKIDGPIVVHVHNFKDAAMAVNARRLAKNPRQIKVVATRHLVKPAKNTPSQLAIYKDLDAIIFVSQLAHDTFVSTLTDFDQSKLHVIHNSISLEPFKGTKEECSPVRLIFTGRIAEGKGLDILIRALDKIKEHNWTLTVCGTGRGRTVMPIVRAARGFGINNRIDWKGYVDDIITELQKSHIAIMPSTAPESFGLAALEAMSQGCAVVTTDNGAQKEFITDGVNGILIAPGDVDALADALGRLINDAALRAHLGENALKHFCENLNYSDFYKKTSEILFK